ncbi:putative extracellular nuclease [Dysgonomonadaceae bacterium PH5-43]|nr:putative extracellular nuclease [Dysgonomonadaceae bacterium PH5-43]
MKPNLYLIILFLLFTSSSIAQNEDFRVMFYNVENLFDTKDNPDKQDDEFTPNGLRRWTNSRFYTKINNLSKVITSAGEWSFPALIGLCEVENDSVLIKLTKHSPIRNAKYNYIITNSPDARGINTALLYQCHQFKYLYHNAIQVSFPDNREKKTRDILYVTGLIKTSDTLDVFVCHFPSRRGGHQQTENDRMYVSSILKQKIDSLFALRDNANIIVLGDFNDQPSDKSMLLLCESQMYNPFRALQQESKVGSYKYQGEWNFLDQILVSTTLLDADKRFHIKTNSARIFQADFLLTPDKTNGGLRPKKSFHGYKHEKGFSDHLPILIDFEVR